jgi:hypothetical protein
MLASRDDPFPFDAVRDLLGILRALYAATRASGGGERRLAAIRRVGLELRAAVHLAREAEPRTLAHSAAWERAERATQQLADLVDCTTPIEPTLSAAAQRIRARPLPNDPRTQSRRARLARG